MSAWRQVLAPLVALCALSRSVPVSACECAEGAYTDGGAYVYATTLFEGTVIGVIELPASSGTRHAVDIRVTRIIRGRLPDRVRVPIDLETSCQVPWNPARGTRVLIAGTEEIAACRGGGVASDDRSGYADDIELVRERYLPYVEPRRSGLCAHCATGGPGSSSASALGGAAVLVVTAVRRQLRRKRMIPAQRTRSP